MDSAAAAAELTRLTPILSAAAELAGVRVRDDTALLALTVDPRDLHRRRVWEAWNNTSGRTGHWGPLVQLG